MNDTHYAYICSAGHSGSTLLDLILGSHSLTQSLGEVSFLAKDISVNNVCSCKKEIPCCEVWREIIEKVDKKLNINTFSSPYSLHLGYSRAANLIDTSHQTRTYLLHRKIIHGLCILSLKGLLPFDNLLLRNYETAIKNNIILFDTIRETFNRQLIIDSTKDYIKGAFLYKKSHPKTKIILLTRDGRAVLYSNRKRGFALKQSIMGWRNYYSRALPILRKHVAEEDLIRVKYEDICNNPEKTVQKICEQLGLTYERSMLDFASHTHHIINGNDIRFGESSEIRLDTKWHNMLDSQDLDNFDKIAGDLNRELGYR